MWRRVTAAYLAFRNKQQANKRIRLGKPGIIVDRSLEQYKDRDVDDGVAKDEINNQAFDDLTDMQNEDFIYVL